MNEYLVYNITRDREINIYDYFSGMVFQTSLPHKTFHQNSQSLSWDLIKVPPLSEMSLYFSYWWNKICVASKMPASFLSKIFLKCNIKHIVFWWVKYQIWHTKSNIEKINVAQYLFDKIRVVKQILPVKIFQNNITNIRRCLKDMVTKQEFVAEHKIVKLVENCQIVANLDNWFWNLVKLDKLKEY